jgi:hypothetical protein
MYDPRVRQHKRIAIIASIFSTIVLLASPLMSRADEPAALPALAPVIITEIQMGSANSASEEFVELYNTTQQPIDLAAHHWQLEIAGSKATGWNTPYRTVELAGTIDPGTYYLVASKYTSGGQPVQYLPQLAGAWFSAGLTATAGHVRLRYTANQTAADGTDTCTPAGTTVDEVEWSVALDAAPAAPSLDKRTVFTTATTSGVPNISSLQRTTINSRYVDTDNDAVDFAVGAPTPAAENILQPESDPTFGLPATLPDPVPLPSDACQPQPPAAGGQGGETPGAGQPGADEPGIPPADSGLASPLITELLPNPASPGTDENDEFIELYNPNSVPFDLSGFVLQTGLTTQHQYTFPEGTNLSAGSFAAFYSRDTGLSLSNSGSRATLLDPLGATLDQSAPFDTAKEAQVWELTTSGWQWSTTPTPGAPNILTAPIVTAAAAVKKVASSVAAASKPAAKSTKSSSSVKGSSTKAKPKPKASAKPQPVVAAAADKPKFNPLQPGVLAVAGAFAILYGAYEYRHDMANKFRSFRANRAARRKAG